MSNLPPVDQNAIAVTAIAQNIINGTPVALAGAHLTPAQVRKYVENVKVQLRSSTFSAVSMKTLIDEAAWRTIWTNWTTELRYKLVGKLSTIFTEAIIAQDVDHPIPTDKVNKILDGLAYAFIASGNSSSKDSGNFHAEFMDVLKRDADYQRKATVEKFVEISDTERLSK